MYHNISKVLFVLGALLYTTATMAKGSAEKVKTNAKETVEATKEYASEKKDEFQASMKKELQTLDAKISELKEKTSKQATSTSVAVKEKTKEEIANLEKQREALNKKLQELSESSDEAWKDVKKGFVKAMDEFKTALRKAVSRYKD